MTVTTDGLPADPAAPKHVKEPVAKPEGDVKPKGTDPEGNPLKVPAKEPEKVPLDKTPENQGGDPEGKPNPVKDEADPAKTAPVVTDLSDENQQVAEAVESAGIKADDLRAAMDKNGGVVPLKALQAMVKTHGDSVANAMAEQLKGMYTAGVKAKADANTAVYSTFEKAFEGSEEGSGKQHFDNAAAWARENLQEGERTGLTDMINSKNEYVRQLGLDKLASAYQGSEKYTQAGDLLSGDNLTTHNVTVIDKSAYQRELTELMDKGYSYESREVQSLQNRRTAAIKRGQ
jgi:hypothetical protein